MVRRKGLAFLGGAVGVLFVLSLLISDALIERALESAGSRIVGARVEFTGVDFHLAGLGLRWQGLQVTNPRDTRRNLFETGTTNLDLRLEPLLLKRVVVDTMSVNGLGFDTPRRTDGALRGAAPRSTPYIEEVQTRLEQIVTGFPVVRLAYLSRLNVDSLIAVADPQTPRKIDSLHDAAKRMFRDADSLLDRLPDRGKIRTLRERIDSIDTGGLTSPRDYLRAARIINSLRKEIDSISAVINATDRQVQATTQRTEVFDELVADWVEQDYRRVAALGRLPDFSAETIALILFGERVVRRVQTALDVIGVARHHGERLRALFPQRESPPRRRGQNIEFRHARNWPTLWVRYAAISGRMMEIGVNGTARNIATTPALIGEPITVEIGGTRPDGASARLRGLFDYRTDIPRERLSFEARQVNLKGMRIGSSVLLPSELEQGRGRIVATLESVGESLVLGAAFTGTGLVFRPETDSDTIEPQLLALRRSLVKGIDGLTIETSLRSVGKDLRFGVSSNVAGLVAGGLRQVIAPSLDTIRTEAMDRLHDEIAGPRKDLDGFVRGEMGEVRQRLEASRALVKELAAELAAKQLGIRKRTEIPRRILP